MGGNIAYANIDLMKKKGKEEEGSK